MMSPLCIIDADKRINHKSMKPNTSVDDSPR